MNRLDAALDRAARTGWLFALVFALNFASFSILFNLEAQFEALTDTPTYDTQNDLTPETLRAQLPLYQGEALAAYQRFAAFDFIFPLAAGVFLAVLWSALLRLNTWPLAGRLRHARLPRLALLGTLFDWLENSFLLTTLSLAPDPADWAVNGAILFKRLKLAGLTLSGIVTIVLLALLVLNWLASRLNRPQTREKMG